MHATRRDGLNAPAAVVEIAPLEPVPRTLLDDRGDPHELKRLVDALVMMVDDEPINSEVTQVHLEEAGYTRFISTSEPREALQLLMQHRPDVVLLDLMMPGMTGFEILAGMAAANILKDVPAIVLTSSTDAATKLKA